MKSALLGTFSPYTCDITSEAKGSFDETMKDIVGVEYTAVAVSTQLVAGHNYNFFCNTTYITNPIRTGAAIVSIYAPLEGRPHITRIQPI
jgi:hypothetical protein